MRRRELIGLFGISAAGWPWIAASQPRRERTARIGYLAPAKIPHLLDAFKNGLRDLGYIEGRNITIEYRFANGEPDDRLAAELAQLAPDIIVTLGTGATIAAKRTAGVIPIVVATAGDLVRNGIVQSLARPGGNVTGTTLYGPELSQKRLEMLKETVPGVKLVSVLGNSSNVYNLQLWSDIQPAAERLGLRVSAVMIPGVGALTQAFEVLSAERPEALIVLSDASFNSARHQIVQLVAENRLAAMYEAREFVEAGGLISYGPNIALMSYRAAAYVDKILKGALPAELPVEEPSTFELHVNLKPLAPWASPSRPHSSPAPTR